MGNISQFIISLHNDLENLISYSKTNDKALKYWAFVQKEQDFYKDGNYLLLQISRIDKRQITLTQRHVDFEIILNIKYIAQGQVSYRIFINAVEQLLEFLYFYQNSTFVLNDFACEYEGNNTFSIKMQVKGVELNG